MQKKLELKQIPKKRVRRDYKGLKGCTTITGDNLGWGGWQLKHWSNRVGREEGLTLNEAMALSTVPGSIVHAMIEAYLWNLLTNHGHYWQEMVDFEYADNDVALAENSFLNFLEWSRQFKLKPIAIEPILINARDGYGSTPDLLAEVLGKLALLDWKSGKFFESGFLQFAANKVNWEYNHPDMPITGGFHLLRIPRNEEVLSFHHSYWDTLPDEAWEAFELCLRLHKIQPILKQLL